MRRSTAPKRTGDVTVESVKNQTDLCVERGETAYWGGRPKKDPFEGEGGSVEREGTSKHACIHPQRTGTALLWMVKES